MENTTTLEFLLELEQQNFWDTLAERCNLNMDWCIEHLNGFEDDLTFFDEWFQKLLENKEQSAESLKLWLLPRLAHEEKQRSFTYPTWCVLQVLGLLSLNTVKEIAIERIKIIGHNKIDGNDPNYYYKLDVVKETMSNIMAVMLRRSYGYYCKKDDFTTGKLTDNFDLFQGDPSVEFDLVWQIIKLPELFDTPSLASSNAIDAVVSGQVQNAAGFHVDGLLDYFKAMPKEEDAELLKFQEAVIAANEKVRKEIEDRYADYYY